MTAKHDLFISHSSTDVAVARELRTLLEAAGYTCWMAPDDVTGTQPWAEQILAGIEHSRAMLVLVSARSNQSTHVSREVQLASSRRRVVLPVRVEAVAPAGALEYHLAGLQRIDVFPPPVAAHRAEILRRLALTVPLAPSATPAPAPEAGPGPSRNVGLAFTSPGSSPSARGGSGNRAGFSAWARANSMLAGSIVTLAALFVVATLAFALNATPPPSSPGPTQSTVVHPSTSAAATTLPTRPTTVTPPTFPPGSGGPFPNEAERVLFAAIPETGKSDIEACDRNESLFSGAIVGMSCNADDRELLFYEAYPDAATQREQYLDLVRGSIGGPDGSCATSPVGDQPWNGPDGRFGRLACGVNDLGLFMFFWTDESRLISVSWYAGYDVDLEAERARGYETFLSWRGG